jgi:hypothetical protein
MENKQERPGCVWLVAAYFVITGVTGLASLYMIRSGVFTRLPGVTVERLAYFSSLSTFDYAVPVLVVLCNLVGLVYLLRLKKQAVTFFLAAFFISMAMTAWHIMSKGYLAVMGRPGMIGFAVGTFLLLVVLGYVVNLRRKGVLQ